IAVHNKACSFIRRVRIDNASHLHFCGVAGLLRFHYLTLVVVGPEEPLVKGIHDYFLSRQDTWHIAIIGPQQQDAQLVGSDDCSEQCMFRLWITTAAYRAIDKCSHDEWLDYLETQQLPIVLKADGLAAGKGVLFCISL